MEGLKDTTTLDFNELAKQYEPMINKILRSLHIFRNKEEFFQTALVGLWEASLRFNPEKGDFTNYAYTYIKGLIMAEMTKKSKYEEHNVYPDDEFWGLIEDQGTEQPFDKKILLSYCEGLTANQIKWFLYTCHDDLSVKDIAQCENVSVSAVKSWRKGAKEKLKRNIQILE